MISLLCSESSGQFRLQSATICGCHQLTPYLLNRSSASTSCKLCHPVGIRFTRQVFRTRCASIPMLLHRTTFIVGEGNEALFMLRSETMLFVPFKIGLVGTQSRLCRRQLLLDTHSCVMSSKLLCKPSSSVGSSLSLSQRCALRNHAVHRRGVVRVCPVTTTALQRRIAMTVQR